MENKIQTGKSIFSFLPRQTEKFEQLMELALDIRWSWSHYADKIWHQINPMLWNLTQNPWAILLACSRETLEEILDDAAFSKELDKIFRDKRESENKPTWFRQNHAKSLLTSVAYFSMEFMLSEALPIYSGGLGNVAGDQLKAASDLGVPVIGVGLLYQQGYFRQLIDKDGAQQTLFPYNDPSQLPITPLRKSNGEWLRLEIKLPGYSVWLRAWQVQVGRVKLYLLDTNDIANFPAHRPITSELYGGGSELRLKQELVLGIGGWRLLQEMGIKPQVCHINEGHAAFAVLERARSLMKEKGVPFNVALATSRAGNLFTTHTPVPAGFDYFEPELIKAYLTVYANEMLGISVDEMLALGRKNPHDHSERFNMAYLAIRGCGAVNAVSKLHGKVSRKLFQPLFDRWPQDDVPVGYVTNGVHMPSWDSSHADQLWTEICGKDRWLGTTQTHDQNISHISNSKLWHLRSLNRTGLIDYVRQRLSLSRAASGNTTQEVEFAKTIFKTDILTIGFARRFASYKRPNLLLNNPERLKQILTNQDCPVQLIIAGKAHPADHCGQSMIQQWDRFVRQPEIRTHAVFLSDYDMQLAERLVQGVDLWINNPVMPHEASGTSGMKVLVNGGLNLSVLDGWWAEAYNPNVGWALGDGREYADDRQRDAVEARMLYNLLEHEIIPEFYHRDENGVPVKWLKRVKESMSHLTQRFSATRTVMEYTQQHYVPAAAAYRKRAAKNCSVGKQIIRWQNTLKEGWSNIEFADFSYRHDADQIVFAAKVNLKGFDPESVRVELYADHVNGCERVIKPMQCDKKQKSTSGIYSYTVTLPDQRPPTDFTPRIVPFNVNASVPLEASCILWQK